MLTDHLVAAGGHIYKRATMPGDVPDSDGMNHLPGWAWLVLFADFLVFFPVFLYIGYTLSHVYPTLAMVEDPQPPAYTPLALDADLTSADPTDPHTSPKLDTAPALTTTSLRRIDALLRTTGGWFANFRGFACALTLNFALSTFGTILSGIPFVPRALGVLLAALATVQLSTAWTHIVISSPSPRAFWRRLPPFAITFRATWLPIAAYWLAAQITGFVPWLLTRAFGLVRWDPRNPTAVPAYTPAAIPQSLVIVLATVACMLFLVIPAQTVLVRVQASLLPPDEDTLVPFDRSFGGVVEPAVIAGQGYIDFVTAWRSFDRPSWIRLYKLLGKILLVEMATYAVLVAIVVPEFVLMVSASKPAVSN